MSDLTDFLEARMQEHETDADQIPENQPQDRTFLIDYIVSIRGIINLHSGNEHDCPGRDGDNGRIADYEQDCPTLMLLARPYQWHPDWRGEWKS